MINNTQNKTISIIELTMKSNNLFHQTLICVKKNDYLKAQKYLNQANELLLQASQIHGKLLLEEKEMSLLLVHGEDLLISVQLYKSMMKEFIDLYKQFPTFEGNQQSSIKK